MGSSHSLPSLVFFLPDFKAILAIIIIFVMVMKRERERKREGEKKRIMAAAATNLTNFLSLSLSLPFFLSPGKGIARERERERENFSPPICRFPKNRKVLNEERKELEPVPHSLIPLSLLCPTSLVFCASQFSSFFLFIFSLHFSQSPDSIPSQCVSCDS